MLTLPSLIITEKNKLSSTGAWIVLLTITMPDSTVIRLARNNEDVVYQGNTFTAFDFSIDEISSDSKGQLPSVVLRIGNAGRVMQAYLEAQDGIVGASVLIQVVNSSLLNQDFSELDLTFEVQKASADARYVSFELGIPSPLNKRFPLYRYSGTICNWVSRFKGAECKYSGPVTSCDGRRSTCISLNNIENWGGFTGLGQGGVRFV
jgi:lambda family phage minor tail protein L